MNRPVTEISSPRLMALALLAFCFTLHAAARGIAEAHAVFLLPLTAEFGWARAEVSGIYAISALVLGVGGPLIGWLFDRFGPARLLLGGLLLAGAAVAAASQASALWQFYLLTGLMAGFGTASLGFVPMAGLLSRWFRQRLNTALAVAHSSHGAGVLLVAPLAQILIDFGGWRFAYLALGLGLLALTPLFLAVRWRAAAAGHPDYRPPAASARTAARGGALTLGHAVRHPAFWGIGWSFLFTSTGMFSVSLQTPAYLVSIGYTPQQAADAFGLLGLLLPVGMVGFGWLGDRIGRHRAVLLSYCLTVGGLGCLLALGSGPSLLFLAGFIVMFGGTFGSRGPAVSTIAATIFQGPQFGRIYGFITVGMGAGGAFGAWLGGFLHDLTGDYRTGIVLAMASLAVAALPFVALRSMRRG